MNKLNHINKIILGTLTVIIVTMIILLFSNCNLFSDMDKSEFSEKWGTDTNTDTGGTSSSGTSSSGTSSSSSSLTVVEDIVIPVTPSYQNFGECTAISPDGSTLAIGTYAEKIYVYRGTGWSTEKIITSPDGVSGDCFGATGIALSQNGNIIVVGALQHDINPNTDCGAVYVFQYNSGTGNWDYVKKLIMSSGRNNFDLFGNSVDISPDGTLIVVGARGASPGGDVYVYSGSSWSTEQLIKSTSSNFEFVGQSVAISADKSTIVIGATGNDYVGADTGAVYVMYGSNWGTQKIIYPNDGINYDNFGYCVDVSSNGSTIAVGSNNNGTNEWGAVYVYNGTNWNTEKKIVASDAGLNNYLGCSVAISADGSTIVTGAYKDNDNGAESGSIYIFNGANWATERKILASDGTDSNHFGISVSITSNGTIVVAGAEGANNSYGSAYVYTL